MKREPGYYWVKMTERTAWSVALYFGGGKWELMGNRPASTHPTTIFFEIKETRIPYPDDGIISENSSIEEIEKFCELNPNIDKALFKLYRHNE